MIDMSERMKKTTWVLAAGAAALQAAEQPNILWIITDDQRPDSLAVFNEVTRGESASPLGPVASPHIDRLAGEGVLFTRIYCNSPACAPSRASMHTGRYPFRSGIYGFEQKLGTIVLGDRRAEIDWSQENEYVITDFAIGADDKKINIPDGLVPVR